MPVPGGPERDVEDVVERRAHAGKGAGREPEEGGDRDQGDLLAELRDPPQDPLGRRERVRRPGGMGRQEPFKELRRIRGCARRNRVRQPGQSGQQQKKERYDREQRVEGERAREERNVVFIGDLDGPPRETPERSVPAPPPDRGQATGSWSSASARRRARASASRRSSSSRA